VLRVEEGFWVRHDCNIVRVLHPLRSRGIPFKHVIKRFWNRRGIPKTKDEGRRQRTEKEASWHVTFNYRFARRVCFDDADPYKDIYTFSYNFSLLDSDAFGNVYEPLGILQADVVKVNAHGGRMGIKRRSRSRCSSQPSSSSIISVSDGTEKVAQAK
jgi:hypothetical protein